MDSVTTVRSRVVELENEVESQGLSGLEAAEYVHLLSAKPESADPSVQLAFGPGHKVVQPVPYEQVIAEIEPDKSQSQPVPNRKREELEAQRVAAAKNYDAVLWGASSSRLEIEDARFALSRAETRVYDVEIEARGDQSQNQAFRRGFDDLIPKEPREAALELKDGVLIESCVYVQPPAQVAVAVPDPRAERLALVRQKEQATTPGVRYCSNDTAERHVLPSGIRPNARYCNRACQQAAYRKRVA